MELLTAIETRASAARLTGPGPSPQDLRQLLGAAERAPDHGRLRPWRLMVLEDELRTRFTAAAEAKRLRVPTLSDAQVAADRDKMDRSPCIIVVGCVVNREQSKIPEIEQVIAAAAAAENLFLAAHALGYGVMWKTGAAAYDAAVKVVLGLRSDDHIIGIMHVGTKL
jgi:nitroreductase